MSTKVALLGTGPMARSVARLLVQKAQVTIWGRNDDARAAVGREVPQAKLTADLGAAVADAEVVLFAISADGLDEVAEKYAPFARPNQVVLLVTRGVTERLELPHEVLRNYTCARWIGFLGGPLHAPELTEGHTVHAVLATRYPDVERAVASLVEGAPIQIHPSRDLLGVQVMGAVASVTALGAGMARGMKLGTTARSVLLAYGLVDARAFGVAHGATAATFTGLAGIGELIPRSVTSLDRHRAVGEKLGAGASLDEALRNTDGRLEGVTSAHGLAERGLARSIPLNLIPAISQVLKGQVSAQDAIEDILARPLGLEA